MTLLKQKIPPSIIRALISRAKHPVAVFRRLWLQSTNANVNLGQGVTIGAGVEIRSTDGASLDLEIGVTVSRGVSLVAQGGCLRIGANSFVGPWTTIVASDSIMIGDNVLIAERVSIRDQNHSRTGLLGQPISADGFEVAPIVIGDGAWIAAGAIILKGVTVGRGAVVAANAVVNRDVADHEIVGGVPAKHIGMRSQVNHVN